MTEMSAQQYFRQWKGKGITELLNVLFLSMFHNFEWGKTHKARAKKRGKASMEKRQKTNS